MSHGRDKLTSSAWSHSVIKRVIVASNGRRQHNHLRIVREHDYQPLLRVEFMGQVVLKCTIVTCLIVRGGVQVVIEL